jgi:hypothetical protein
MVEGSKASLKGSRVRKHATLDGRELEGKLERK